MHIGPTGGPKRHIFHDFAFVPLSKSCFPPRAGSIFSKNGRICFKETVLGAWKAQRKQQIVHEIHKIANVMHTLIFAERLWMRKMHETAARSYLLKGAWSEEIANRTGKGATRANKSGKHGSYEGRLWVRKVICLMQSARSRFAKSCFPL